MMTALKQLEENLQDKAKELSSLNNQTDIARKKTLCTEIWSNLFQYICKKYNNNSYYIDILNDAILKRKCLDRYCYDKNPNFIAYISNELKFMKKTVYDQTKTDELNTVALLQYSTDEDKEIENPKVYTTDEEEKNISANSSLIQLNYNIIHFGEHKSKKTYNSIRLAYYKMFYTENVSAVCKEFTIAQLNKGNKLNQQQIFSAMNTSFLDFYMSNMCRTMKEISYTPLKKYVEVIPDAPENKKFKELDFTLDQRVYANYLKNIENKNDSLSNISQMKSKYQLELKELHSDLSIK